MDLPVTLDKDGELKAAIVAKAQTLTEFGERWDFMLGCRFGLRERERDEPFDDATIAWHGPIWRLGRDLTLHFTG